MIELDVDMEYCLDADMLGYIILHDENGEMDDMVFVPERTCHWEWNVEEGYWVCSNCGPISPEDYHKIPNYCPECGARVVKKDC